MLRHNAIEVCAFPIQEIKVMWGLHVEYRVFYYFWDSEVGEGGNWVNKFPVVVGSTKICTAIADRNLKQCSGGH